MEKVLNASKRWVISVLIHRHSQMWGALASSTAAAAFGVPSATGAEVFCFKMFQRRFFFEDGDISIMIPLLAVPLSSVIVIIIKDDDDRHHHEEEKEEKEELFFLMFPVQRSSVIGYVLAVLAVTQRAAGIERHCWI